LKKIPANIKSCFFLLLFLAFFGSNNLFSHVHIVDGVALAHSHPFRHGENRMPSHTHTPVGFLYIYFMLNFNAALIVFLLLKSFLSSPGTNNKRGYISNLKLQPFQTPVTYRGPPYYSILRKRGLEKYPA